MVKYLVLGAGKMGVVAAKDIVESSADCQVTLVDISFERLKKAADFIQSKRLVCLQRDLEDEPQRAGVFEGQDVALGALIHKHSMLAFETAVRRGVHYVDMVGEWPLERLAYDEEAKRKGVILITGLGVSPGITNVCVGRGVHLLDETDHAKIYVGGNPMHAKPPLNYRIVYSVDSLLNFYDRPVPILRNGEQVKVPPLSDVEPIAFPAPFEDMECFYTDGLNSLLHTMKGRIKGDLFEKTVRHRGHAAAIRVLKDCGFFSKTPVRIGEREVVPWEVLEVLLKERLKLGDEMDVTLLRLEVSGKKAGRPKTHVFEMVDYADKERRTTSMAKTTGFPASIAVQMIAAGTITQRGSLFPEEVFHNVLFDPFLAELAKRGVMIIHAEK